MDLQIFLSTGGKSLKVTIGQPEKVKENFISAAILQNNQAITNCARNIKKQNKRDGGHSM